MPNARLVRRSLILLSIASAIVMAAEQNEKPNLVVLIPFEGEIEPLGEHAFYRKLDEARSLGADVVIVEIDSPGGLVSSSIELAERLQDVTWAKTVAFIPDQAISGAAMMSLGCNEIVMSSRAKIGDVGPIVLGEDSLFRHAPEKIVSHLAQVMRDLAEENGRPPAIAEAMVDRDMIVYRVENEEDGEVRFLSDAEIKELEDADKWKKRTPVRESEEGRFLTTNGERAVEMGLADSLAEDRAALAASLGIQESDLRVLETDWVDTTVMILTSWPITALLVVVGLIALYVELLSPGVGFGALLAGLCAVLFFWSRFLGGTSGWLEVVLFAAGIVFLLVEIFVLPGFGISGVTGGLLLFASFVMASQRAELSDGLSLKDALHSLWLLMGASLVSFIAMAYLGKHFGKIPLLNRFALQPPESTDGPSTVEAIVTSSPVSIGQRGVADSTLRPAGRAKFEDEYIDVVTDGSFLEAGQEIEVVDIKGHRIMVRAVQA